MCHNYILEQDFNCELKENTTHFEIRLVTSANQLDIKPSLSITTVTIDDSRESECCELYFSYAFSSYSYVWVKVINPKPKQTSDHEHEDMWAYAPKHDIFVQSVSGLNGCIFHA